MDEYTKMYLAKKGEGDMKGWYARPDLKTDREIKEGVEGNLERACVASPYSLVITYSNQNIKQVQGRRAQAPVGPARADELVPEAPRRRPLRRSNRAPSTSILARPLPELDTAN